MNEQASDKTVKCPECGALLELKSKEGNPRRLVAFHSCKGLGSRQVYETDAPDWPPPVLEDRLEQSEYMTPKSTRSKKYHA